MTITAARSVTAAAGLCGVLERNDIKYDVKDNGDIACIVNGREGDIRLVFRTDCSKMLVTLYSPLAEHVPLFFAGDAALAVCMMNSRLTDGTVCYDISGGTVYFRMTASFYNSDPTEFMFEYLLSAAAEAVDEYRPRLKKLMICTAA